MDTSVTHQCLQVTKHFLTHKFTWYPLPTLITSWNLILLLLDIFSHGYIPSMHYLGEQTEETSLRRQSLNLNPGLSSLRVREFSEIYIASNSLPVPQPRPPRVSSYSASSLPIQLSPQALPLSSRSVIASLSTSYLLDGVGQITFPLFVFLSIKK